MMKKLLSIIFIFCIMFSSLIISKAAETENKFFLVLGDSISFGSGLRNPEEACYGKIVADTNGYGYANHSVPGHTSADLIIRLSDESVKNDLEKADIICISIGGNDFLLGNVSDLIFDVVLENDYSRFDIIAENFYNNLCTVISTIRNYTDAVILIQNLYNPQSGELKELYQQAVDRLNNALTVFDEEHPGEIFIVDVASVLNASEGNFAKDDVHPSSVGNEIIAKTIISKLYSLGLGSSVQPVINDKGIDIREPYLRNFVIKILIFTVKNLAYLYKLI